MSWSHAFEWRDILIPFYTHDIVVNKVDHVPKSIVKVPNRILRHHSKKLSIDKLVEKYTQSFIRTNIDYDYYTEIRDIKYKRIGKLNWVLNIFEEKKVVDIIENNSELPRVLCCLILEYIID